MFGKLTLAALALAGGGFLAATTAAEDPGPVLVHQVTGTQEPVLPFCFPKPVELEEPGQTEPLRPADVPCTP
ncbi:hypothetical protein [Nocardia sp. NPDC051832]|uniref:hypothetical protein n=1 Tax=Nocardia sp. NPDC051832 TaxID=3155673 RepID=UPI003438BA48